MFIASTVGVASSMQNLVLFLVALVDSVQGSKGVEFESPAPL